MLDDSAYISINAGSWTNNPGLLGQQDGRCGYFYWSQIQGAAKYIFQLSTSASMANPTNLTVNDADASVVYFYSALKANTTYYYRVQPVGVSFPDWSAIKTVTTPSIDPTDRVCAGYNP